MNPTKRLALRVDLPSETMLLASGLPSEKAVFDMGKRSFCLVRHVRHGIAIYREIFLKMDPPKMGLALRIR